MPKSFSIAKWLLVGASVVFLLNGCALWDRFFKEEEKTPDQLMSEGMEDFKKGKYEEATEIFQKIKDRYPYSKFALEAELRMADSLFNRDQYMEAFDAYGEFEKLHPKNPNIPYVIYQKGMCHFNQMSTVDRDQSNTLKAKDEFERLVRRFRRSEYANMARRKIRECYINLAEHELYVGNYYFRMKKYRTAMSRYLYLIENYPDLGQYHVALEYLKKCKEKLAQEEAARDESWWKKLIPSFLY
ncbi:MAG: outer membrane protein assembly factor BamD [Pseudomonadota bacterium]